MQPEAFIKKYQDEIIVSTMGTPLLPSVKMAQACLETGYGASLIGEAKNMFGIKAAGDHTPYWKGDSVSAGTFEVYSGVQSNITAKFRKYKTITDSIRDHSHLLMTVDRYKPVRQSQTATGQAYALQEAGYATATNYANTLISIIDKYDLRKLDSKKKIMKYVKLSLAVAALALVVWVSYEQIKY
jgi:flagellum-specific peptidoglycan hydrolase FlgJ